jgi:hypothetical protein
MSKNDKVQIRKAIINLGGTQFNLELNMQFNGNNLLPITKIEYKKFSLAAYSHKQLLCKFFDCPVYIEYV